MAENASIEKTKALRKDPTTIKNTKQSSSVGPKGDDKCSNSASSNSQKRKQSQPKQGEKGQGKYMAYQAEEFIKKDQARVDRLIEAVSDLLNNAIAPEPKPKPEPKPEQSDSPAVKAAKAKQVAGKKLTLKDKRILREAAEGKHTQPAPVSESPMPVYYFSSY